jgi:hypothetical protein
VQISGDRRTAHFRAHERRLVQLRASVWFAGAEERAQAQVLNLGLGGAGIASRASLRQEDHVMLTLLAPSLLDPLVLSSRVAWVRLPQRSGFLYAGIAFEAPDRTTLLTLFQLIGTLTF